MKKTKIIALILAACLVLSCCSCGGANLGGKKDGSGSSPADISAAAMENFVKKLEADNYVISGESGPVTNVVSPEVVYIEYGKGKSSSTFVFMTLNGETFKAEIEGKDKIEEVAFVSNDNAADYLSEILPNNWMALSGGNMWELFYNDTAKPLEFTSNDDDVKRTLAGLGGYGEFTLSRMEEVHMVLDAEDPKTVSFTAVVTDAPPVVYEDLALTLKFGSAKEDNRISKWLKNPVYPEKKTEWTQDDIYTLDNVFNRGYGETAFPFPGTSSYALILDPKAYSEFTGIRMLDGHWTEEDLENYGKLLKDSGFQETTGERLDGSTGTVYRRLLREEYDSYSQLELYYDNGAEIIGRRYNDCPEYNGIEAISDAVQEYGFAALPDTDVFTGWTAQDTGKRRSEDWIYYFDYNFYMSFSLTYSDKDSAKEYLENYADSLLDKGFISRFVAGEENGKYTSANEYVVFQYKFSETDDTVIVSFSDQKSLSVLETLMLLKEHGLPETDIHGDIAAKDVARYYYELGEFQGLFLYVYQPYSSIEEAEKYLDSYVPGLEDQGYYEFNPQALSSNRQFLYFNEELRKYVAFDLIPGTDGAQILFEIVSYEYDTDSDSIMMKAIGR